MQRASISDQPSAALGNEGQQISGGQLNLVKQQITPGWVSGLWSLFKQPDMQNLSGPLKTAAVQLPIQS